MLKASTLLVAVFFAFSATAQETHNHHLEMLEEYYSGKITADEAVSKQLEVYREAQAQRTLLKCITPLNVFVHKNKGSLSAETLNDFEQTIGSTSLQSAATYISESGKFEINYEVVGSDAVPPADNNDNSIPDYVEWVAEAADFSYEHEIETLGFTDPIPNGSSYKVFIRDLGAYGLTRTSASDPGGTVIEIENDFVGFPPNDDPEGDQKGAIKVTMAHEFKHSIQFTQTGWSGDSDRWVEMDATLLEEVVYDQVNDYYNYISGFGSDLFSSASTTLIPGSYEDITWSLYFHEKYGELFWTDVWSRIENNVSLPLLTAVDQELVSMGESYLESVLESYMWHFASGPSHTASGFGFDEASNYPGPTLTQTFNGLFTELSNEFQNARFSAKYFLLNPNTDSEGKLRLNLNVSSSDIQIGLLIYSNSDNTVEPYYVTAPTANNTVEVNTDFDWNTIEKVGIVVVNTDQVSPQTFTFSISDYISSGIDTSEIPGAIELSQNYPNPFNPNTNIRVTTPQAERVTLKVYDYMGREIQTLFDGNLNQGTHNFLFDASQLSSGVYFYRLVSDAGSISKTMTLLK